MTPERKELEALFAIGEQSAAELAAQHKPVCTVIDEALGDGTTRVRLSPEFRGRLRHGTQLYAALEQPGVDPVAWAKKTEKKLRITVMQMDETEGWRPLVYGDTAHQQVQERKPINWLSDDEVSQIAISHPPNVHRFAEAIELAVLKKNKLL